MFIRHNAHSSSGHKVTILGIPRQIEEMKGQTKKQKPGKKPKARSLDSLQKMLIAQLSGYPSKIGFDLPSGVISDRNIVDIQYQANDSTIVNCGFSCPFCNKVIKITFKRYWWASNAKKHLKTHVDMEIARNTAM